jgi:hypothetical protein
MTSLRATLSGVQHEILQTRKTSTNYRSKTNDRINLFENFLAQDEESLTVLTDQLQIRPQIKWPKSFQFRKEYSDLLASSCDSLLSAVPRGLTEAMRMEFSRNLERPKEWELVLKLDPILWFDQYHHDTPNDKLVTLARSYIDEERQLIYQLREKKDIGTIPTIELPEYCEYGIACNKLQKGITCDKFHPQFPICCEYLVPRKGGTHRRPYGWQLAHKLHLRNDRNEYFLLLARPGKQV